MVEITLPIVLQILQTSGILVGIIYYITIMRNAQRNQRLQLETRQTQLFMDIYQNTVTHELRARNDVETDAWLEGLEYEDLVGEGTRTYSFELTAPEEETTWTLAAIVRYYSEGEWMHDEVDWIEPFTIQVSARGQCFNEFHTPENH